jgi:hypothetical protein
LDRFGRSVSLSGGVALAGAPYADISGHADQGAAYVFAPVGVTFQIDLPLVMRDR